MFRLIIFSVLVLASCAERKSPEEIARHYEGVCQTYGFKPGTDAMAQCIASEVQTAKTERAVRSGNALNAYNTTYNAATAPYR